jgi:hypothetical protein
VQSLIQKTYLKREISYLQALAVLHLNGVGNFEWCWLVFGMVCLTATLILMTLEIHSFQQKNPLL